MSNDEYSKSQPSNGNAKEYNWVSSTQSSSGNRLDTDLYENPDSVRSSSTQASSYQAVSSFNPYSQTETLTQTSFHSAEAYTTSQPNANDIQSSYTTSSQNTYSQSNYETAHSNNVSFDYSQEYANK